MVAFQGGLIRHGVRRAVNFLNRHGRRALLCLPFLFVTVFLIVPLGLTIVVSFWERTGLKFRPAFSLASYTTIVEGARLDVLTRSVIVAMEATAISLLLAYPIAYFLARKARPQAMRIVLVLFTVPFLINYIVRNVAWTSLLGRNGTVNTALIESGIAGSPLDWLLYSDFAVFLGMISTYMPFMIFPLVLSIAAIDRQFLEASADLGASAFSTFRRITLPLSLPGIFAAIVFGFVGAMGESAVPVIMGGVGYELLGNTITSSMDVLNYPLAAALSSLVVALMLMLMAGWYVAFDLKTFLGKILEWRS